jgi:sugar phosphate isomerase/epimerase
MFVEGSSSLPRNPGDVDRFEAEIRTAQQVGATVVRTVMLGGRRYETFTAAEQFREFIDRSWKSLQLAEPVAARHGVRLAIENHKDFRVPELLAMLKRIDSPQVGVCVDTGNSMALLEDPMQVVEAYAPWAFSVHLKDMAVEPYDGGFLLAEVPLGQGILDLTKMVDVLRRARPEVQFTLEMITRDPLKIPCLSDPYWATLDDVSGRELVRTLTLVRTRAAKEPLPRIDGLPSQQRLRIEDDNVRKCLAYARGHFVQ